MSIHMQNPVFIKILVFCSSWIFICIDFDFFNYLKIAFICKSKSQRDTTSQPLGQSQSTKQKMTRVSERMESWELCQVGMWSALAAVAAH